MDNLVYRLIDFHWKVLNTHFGVSLTFQIKCEVIFDVFQKNPQSWFK